MKLLILITLCLVFQFYSYAQDTLRLKPVVIKSRIYEAKIQSEKGVLYDHYLAEVQDSAILVSKAPVPYKQYSGGTGTLKFIGVSEIETISLQRKGRTGRGALYGGLIGAGAGVIIGLTSGGTRWFSTGAVTVGSGLLMGGAGAIVGAVVGAVSQERYYIGGNKDRLQQMNASLLRKASFKK
jgi:hypothetical protein